MNLTITPINAQNRKNVAFEAFKTTPEAAKTISYLKDEIVVHLGNKEDVLKYLPKRLSKNADEIAKKYPDTFLSQDDFEEINWYTRYKYDRTNKRLEDIAKTAINIDSKSVENVSEEYVTRMTDVTAKAYSDAILSETPFSKALEEMNESIKSIKETAINALKELGL